MTRRSWGAVCLAAALVPGPALGQPGPNEPWSHTVGNWQAECVGVVCSLRAGGGGVVGPSVIMERGAGDPRIWLVLDDPPVNPGQTVHYRCDDGPEGNLSAGRQLEIDREDRTRLEVANGYLIDGLQVLFAECQHLVLRYQSASAVGRDDEEDWVTVSVSMAGYTALTDALNAHLSGRDDD